MEGERVEGKEVVGREEGLLLLPTIRILYSHNRPQNIPDLRLRHVYYWSILMLTLAGPGSGRGRGGGTDSYYLGSHIVHLAVRVCGYSPLPTTEVGLTKTGREWLCCVDGMTRLPFANLRAVRAGSHVDGNALRPRFCQAQTAEQTEQQPPGLSDHNRSNFPINPIKHLMCLAVRD